MYKPFREIFDFLTRGPDRRPRLLDDMTEKARELETQRYADGGKKALDRALGKHAKTMPAVYEKKGIVQHLVDENLIDEAQGRAATMAARARGISVSTVLAEQGAVPRDKLTAAIEATDVSALVAGLEYDVRIPRKLLRDNIIIVHAQTDSKLMISTTSSPVVVEQQLQPFSGGRTLMFLPFSYLRWDDFEPNIDRIIEPGTNSMEGDTYYNPVNVVGTTAEDSEVLDIILDLAAEYEASDIHIEPFKGIYNVFFRILGVRQLFYSGKIDQYNPICAMVKDRARIDPMETRIPQDGSFSTQIRGRGYDIRVATLPTDGREKIVMRLLDPIRAQMPLRQLGISGIDVWRDITRYRNGLVLIVGATGSGKTTTLNATIRELPRFAKSIYTAEDPVEYQISYVTHVQMNPMQGLDFARAIKAFMRADPDIIVLGEIRDDETAKKAIQAAETGHLVIATIHAESVSMGLRRLNGLGVKPIDYDSLLRGILVQFLVRTICHVCKGEGCDACKGVGYDGRSVVSEVAHFESIDHVNRALNNEVFWSPLWKDLEVKVTSGVTDGREVYRCFTSEMTHFAKHSKVLARINAEERAKRGIQVENFGFAQIEEMGTNERRQMWAKGLASMTARLGEINPQALLHEQETEMRSRGVDEEAIAIEIARSKDDLEMIGVNLDGKNPHEVAADLQDQIREAQAKAVAAALLEFEANQEREREDRQRIDAARGRRAFREDEEEFDRSARQSISYLPIATSAASASGRVVMKIGNSVNASGQVLFGGFTSVSDGFFLAQHSHSSSLDGGDAMSMPSVFAAASEAVGE